MSRRDWYRGSLAGKRAIDEVGRTLAGVRVIEKLMTVGVGARFRAIFPCGHTIAVEGTRLRAVHKRGGVLTCQECRRAARGGTS